MSADLGLTESAFIVLDHVGVYPISSASNNGLTTPWAKRVFFSDTGHVTDIHKIQAYGMGYVGRPAQRFN
jgi:hypothetical protein